MGFVDRFKSILAGPGQVAPILWLYVQCDKCGSPVAVRINLHNDPSLDDEGGWILRKEIMDSKCFRLMSAELHFDNAKRVTEQTIQGGKFITQQEYEQLTGKPHPG